MADSEDQDRKTPDRKTQEFFKLLGISEPSKREEFIRMASAGTVGLNPQLPAHFRLDSLTSITEDKPDAELA